MRIHYKVVGSERMVWVFIARNFFVSLNYVITVLLGPWGRGVIFCRLSYPTLSKSIGGYRIKSAPKPRGTAYLRGDDRSLPVFILIYAPHAVCSVGSVFVFFTAIDFRVYFIAVVFGTNHQKIRLNLTFFLWCGNIYTSKYPEGGDVYG